MSPVRRLLLPCLLLVALGLALLGGLGLGGGSSAARAAAAAAARPVHDRQITLVNRTRVTIWPASTPGAVNGRTGWTLPAGKSLTITVPDTWNARLWGRTGCHFNAAGHGSCVTGGCGEVYQCQGWAPPLPTLFETDFDSYDHLDFYDVSMVDGSNLPMYVNTIGGTTPDKVSARGCYIGHGCTSEVQCPSALAVRHHGAVVACISPCNRSHSAAYCNRPPTMWPIDYATVFKRAEPYAYSWSGDNSATFAAAGRPDYRITFGITPPRVGGPPG